MRCRRVLVLAVAALLLAAVEGDVGGAGRKSAKVGGAGGGGTAGAEAAALVFAEDLRLLLERCSLALSCGGGGGADLHRPPPGTKRGVGAVYGGNWTGGVGREGCAQQHGLSRELPARLAELSLRAALLSRSRACDSQLAVSLAQALGDLARRIGRPSLSSPTFRVRVRGVAGGSGGGGAGAGLAADAATADAAADKKPRKLSKSQKMKLQAKQKTALAVKKKAAAAAAAAAASAATAAAAALGGVKSPPG